MRIRRFLVPPAALVVLFAVIGLDTTPAVPAPLADGPVGRWDMGLAPDPLGRVVLFGGLTVNTNGRLVRLGDTWTWDGSAWTEQHPADHPEAWAGMEMAFDEVRNEVVLFGGSNSIDCSN